MRGRKQRTSLVFLVRTKAWLIPASLTCLSSVDFGKQLGGASPSAPKGNSRNPEGWCCFWQLQATTTTTPDPPRVYRSAQGPGWELGPSECDNYWNSNCFCTGVLRLPCPSDVEVPGEEDDAFLTPSAAGEASPVMTQEEARPPGGRPRITWGFRQTEASTGFYQGASSRTRGAHPRAPQ